MYSFNTCKQIYIQAKQQVDCMQADAVKHLIVTNVQGNTRLASFQARNQGKMWGQNPCLTLARVVRKPRLNQLGTRKSSRARVGMHRERQHSGNW